MKVNQSQQDLCLDSHLPHQFFIVISNYLDHISQDYSR